MNRIVLLKSSLSIHWIRVLLILFTTQLMTAVGFSSIFPFLTMYVKSLGSSTGLSIELLSGLAFSSQAFTMMIASPFWGNLADRYGRKLMVERAMFGGSILLLLMAFVSSAEQLVFLRTIQGFITGTVAATNALVAAEVPRKNIGFAMGMLQVGSASGVALGPIIGGAIADRYGYGTAFYITAAMLLLGGIMVNLGVHEDTAQLKVNSNGSKNILENWRGILSSQGVIITYGMRFVSQLGRMMIIPIAPLFIIALLPDIQQVNTTTGLIIGIASGTTMVSAVFLGRLSDQIGHRRIVIICILSAAALYIFQSLVSNVWQLLIMQGLVGIALGGIIPSISALLAKFTKEGEEGRTYGLDNSVDCGARSIAPMVSMWAATAISLRSTFTITGILFLIAGLLAIWRLPAFTVPSEEKLNFQFEE